MFVAEMKHFLDCIAAGKPTELPLEDGLESLRIVAAARRDGKSRQSGDAAKATNGIASK